MASLYENFEIHLVILGRNFDRLDDLSSQDIIIYKISESYMYIKYLKRIRQVYNNCKNIKPDITFILDVSVDQSNERINKRDIDRIEQSGADFLNRVKEGYVKIAQKDTTRYILIDCLDKSIELIKNEIIETVNIILDL